MKVPNTNWKIRKDSDSDPYEITKPENILNDL